MLNLIQTLRMEATQKSRHKKTQIQSGDILSITTTQYKNKKRKQNLKGICIGIKKRIGYTTIQLRNFIGGVSQEQSFILESPIINNIEIIGKIKGNTKAKKYYLRTKSPSENKV
uniref:Large ribosomal subunit protein bL19m n=1 Tax=Reclinomonas americana TaxID=48483 RepID=RM19_RECAM|nr:ribosomal protein L19 [Reclinomonas americana]O21264.1 RecName: Full=Large ribosomal subunit protein bL19m; AltName: Full=60S ribosomal protein L19, mitochondrial [Reclinomonas americana]AAD11891.1 ribosomal protein L19 [Reclinomonas americana]